MADNLSHHLRNMKRRLKNTQTPTSTSNMSQLEKVDMLENALSTFRSEVNMKLEIMQQILTTRNEQVSVQKKLLDREQNLYNVLLGHWMNSPKLAASGLSMNFSTEVQASLDDFDYENEENLSDPDYTSGDDLSAGPSRKKSKSSLRRQRKSGRNIPKHNKTQNVETTDPLGHEKNPNATDDGSDTADQPGNQLEIQMKCEYDDEDNRAGRIDFDFVGQSDFPDQSEIEVATGSQNTGVQDNPNSSSLNLTGLSTTPDNDAHAESQKRRRGFSAQTKLNIIKFANETSVNKASKIHGVDRAQIKRWIIREAEYRSQQEAGESGVRRMRLPGGGRKSKSKLGNIEEQ